MGGRGGSSGAGGGGGSAAIAKMPELTGSEKQIAWANSIRNNMLQAADELVQNSKKRMTK